jgi:hypothetical protein
MTTRRVRLSERGRVEHRITPAAVAHFKAGEWLLLHRALGLRPWHPSPLDAVGECPWPPGCGGHEAWPLVVRLRAELLKASR